MATVTDLIRLAESQLGVTESPAGSNRVKYNRDYYGWDIHGPEYPWCCVFQWWLFHAAGADALFFGGKKTAHCDTLYDSYRRQGRLVSLDALAPGDLVFFNFHGRRDTMDHVGLCVSAEPGYVTTIDGNTGSTSEANGGAVLRRRRPMSVVLAAARPAYEREAPQKPPREPVLHLYHSLETVPPYFRRAAEKAAALGVLGRDSSGHIIATYSSLQALTWMDRLGLLDRKES